MKNKTDLVQQKISKFANEEFQYGFAEAPMRMGAEKAGIRQGKTKRKSSKRFPVLFVKRPYGLLRTACVPSKARII